MTNIDVSVKFVSINIGDVRVNGLETTEALIKAMHEVVNRDIHLINFPWDGPSKVIDIKNEAPEFIKSKYIEVAELTPTTLDMVDGSDTMYGDLPTANTSQISFDEGLWNGNLATLFTSLDGRKLIDEPLSFIFYGDVGGEP